MHTWRNILSSLLVVLLALSIIIRPAKTSGFNGQVGQSVNHIRVVSGSGKTKTLGQILHHHPALINFFATWCPACKMELPDLHQVVAAPNQLILISQGNSASTAVFLQHYGIASDHSFYDPSGHVFNSFFITTLPTSYFVNRNGIIVSKVIGPMTPHLIRQNLRLADTSQER